MTQDGGPAFPVVVGNQGPEGHQVGHHEWQAYGMSLRDYFAAKALQGMLADSQLSGVPDEWASRSYRLADAMIAARKA